MAKLKMLGWFFLVAGVSLMMSPLISNITGFAVTTLSMSFLPEIKISFSPATFALGAISAVIGVVIVNPKKESVLDG